MNKKVFELVGFICSCAGCALTMLFSIITCARGTALTEKMIENIEKSQLKISVSLAMIGVIVGLIAAIVGLVFSILSIDRQAGVAGISKFTIAALAVACFTLFYGIITTTTICGYTCKINDSLSVFRSFM